MTAGGSPSPSSSAVCARCGLDVAAHRVEIAGTVWCSAFCARAASSTARAASDATCPPSPGVDIDAELLAVLAECGREERRVLLVLARRLLAGQHAYGRLDLAHDARDFRRERAEELADALCYGAFAEVAATLRDGAMAASSTPRGDDARAVSDMGAGHPSSRLATSSPSP